MQEHAPPSAGATQLVPEYLQTDELARVDRRLALLAGAASGLLRSDQPSEYVRDLFHALAEHLGIDAYFNFLVVQGDGTPRLRLDSYAGVPDEVARGFESLDFGSAVCGMVAAERRARIVDDVQRSTDPLTRLIRSLGISAYAAYPLIARDELVGTLSFGLRDRTAFEPDEVELLRTLADQVAVAIDRAATREAEHRAREEAERASEAKSQFLSTMTHDLRTPLTAILGFADIIQSGMAGPTTEQQNLHLGRIKSATWHLVSIMDQILAFSRSEAGKLAVDHDQVDLARIARDVVDVLAGEAERKGLDVRMNGAAGIVVRTDGGKVRQILANLVGNAIRYTDAGFVEVAVTTSEEWMLCAVRDTGCGIEPESIEDIFEPFVQVGPPSPEGGSGLGLAVSRRFARLLGGDVDVESTPGRGSTFTLRLPIT